MGFHVRGAAPLAAALMLALSGCSPTGDLVASLPELWMAGAGTDDSGASTRLGVAAVCMRTDPDPAVNRAAMVTFVDSIVAEHPEVRLIVFGETALGLYYRTADPEAYQRSVAESVPGPTFAVLSAEAQAHAVNIAFGLAEDAGGTLYNTAVLIGPDGSEVARHRKTHLAGWDIADGFEPGTGVTFTKVDGRRTAIIICYDSMDAELVRAVGEGTPDLVICPLADQADEAFLHCDPSAVNFGAWSIFANRVGDEDGNLYDGHLWISDPTGCLRAKAAGQAGYIYVEAAL